MCGLSQLMSHLGHQIGMSLSSNALPLDGVCLDALPLDGL